MLLAVDLGLRCGLAVYGEDGRLLRYRSQHFGNVSALKRGVWGVLKEIESLDVVYVEGDRALGDVWSRAAQKQGARVRRVSAETWRPRLLLSREQRSGPKAKEAADTLARSVIGWSDARRPTSLRHDAAEAILIGLFGVLEEGWLGALPPELLR
jgi:hypothetical protein